MANKPKRKPDDPAQSKRFIETARNVKGDKSAASLKRALEIIALAKKPQAAGKAK